VTTITTDFNISYPAANTASFSGEGTEENPYVIKTAQELALLSQKVDEGETFTGKYFVLGNDIDMSGQTSSYSPIGNYDNKFDGSFDGKGYSISNLKVDGRGFNYVGLFGYIDANAKVQNVKFTNPAITGQGNYVAVLSGVSDGTISNITIENVSLVTSGNLTAGITAFGNGSISDININGGTISGQGSVGGVVGQFYGNLTNCAVKANLYLTGYISATYFDLGGIAGALSTKNYDQEGVVKSKMQYCYVSGQIVDSYGYGCVGGLVGRLFSADMSDCFNTATISAKRYDVYGDDTYTGGLAADVHNAVVENCYNAGTIIKTDTSNGVGGLIGYYSYSLTTSSLTGSYLKNLSTIKNCYNSGQIISTSSATHKGIYGDMAQYSTLPLDITTVITNCYYDSQILGFTDEENGRTTSFFVSGTLPETFSSDSWEATENYYPGLKGIADNPAKRLSRAALLFANGETYKKVKSTFNVSSYDDLDWAIISNSTRVKESDALTISGNSVSLKGVYSTEVLSVANSENVSRLYRVAVVPKVFEGDGTAESPYLIRNVADFKLLDDAVGKYYQPHEGDYFTMTQDIDFELTDDFQGVGARKGLTATFGGVFDGGNHTIHKLKVDAVGYDDNGTAVVSKSYPYGGLFNILSENGVVKNLTMAADCQFNFIGVSGAIVGASIGRVENCRNYADINVVANYGGGIIGQGTSTSVVSNCYNSGNVKVGTIGVGGIVGYGAGLVELSQNDGDVELADVNVYSADKEKNDAGGIAGYCIGTVDRCINNGTITGRTNIGGLVGRSANLVLTNSINSGLAVRLDDTGYVGGLAGYTDGRETITNDEYDSSINVDGAVKNGSSTGASALSTVVMTTATRSNFPGFATSELTLTKGKYPVLTAFKDEEGATTMRSINIQLADVQTRNNILSSVDLSSDSNLGITWKLTVGKYFKVVDNNQLTVEIPDGVTMINDTLVAECGKYKKRYAIACTPPTFLEGKGTKESPFLIKTKLDINNLSDFIAETRMDYQGYYLRVENDIDFEGDSLKVVSYGTVNFQGDFDGNGKTIKNYVYSNNNAAATALSGPNLYVGKYLGLFGNVGDKGYIHDLTIEGNMSAHSYVAGLVGKLYGKVENCVNKSVVTALTSNYTGGLVCYAYAGSSVLNCKNDINISSLGYTAGLVSYAYKGSEIANCVNNGNITAGDNMAAGIVSSCAGTVHDCVNNGNIELTKSKSKYAGGIISGAVTGMELENCVNYGNVTTPADASYAGGIIGYNVSSTQTFAMKNCHNEGNITAGGYVGGIVGCFSNIAMTMDSCYNIGAITATGTSNYCAGIAGSFGGKASYISVMKNCYNKGKISSIAKYVGGIMGYNNGYTEIYDCYNLADVEMTKSGATLAIGGISGSNNGIMKYCWNAGNITTQGYGAGGVAGLNSSKTAFLEQCFNLGNVKAAYTNKTGVAGGIIAYTVQACTLKDCYNMGNVEGPGYIGGIVGMISAYNPIISNCYNNGSVTGTVDNAPSVSPTINLSYELETPNLYYNSDKFTATEDQTIIGTGLSTVNLRNLKIDDSFLIANATLPVLDSIADKTYAAVAASGFILSEEDTETKVKGNVALSYPYDNAEWSCSEQFSIDELVAKPRHSGEGWIKISTPDGDYSKTYELVVVAGSGVDENGVAKEVKQKIYYDLNGCELTEPSKGIPCIIRIIYTDGTTSTVKVIEK
jgi:hypothetical protein